MKNLLMIIAVLFSFGIFAQNQTINLNGGGSASGSTSDSSWTNIQVDTIEALNNSYITFKDNLETNIIYQMYS